MSPVTLGLLAGAFTTFASLPQIVRIVRTRSMNDISLITLCMFTGGVALWLVYGMVIHAMPVIVWNALSLALYFAQIALKIGLTEPAILGRIFPQRTTARNSA